MGCYRSCPCSMRNSKLVGLKGPSREETMPTALGTYIAQSYVWFLTSLWIHTYLWWEIKLVEAEYKQTSHVCWQRIYMPQNVQHYDVLFKYTKTVTVYTYKSFLTEASVAQLVVDILGRQFSDGASSKWSSGRTLTVSRAILVRFLHAQAIFPSVNGESGALGGKDDY